MRALSVRQPWAELILRGVKTVEYRSRPTRIVGERFWIYASKNRDEVGRACPEHVEGMNAVYEAARRIWSNELAVPGTLTGGGTPVPRWMLELAEALILGKLPTGV